jgi:hypothetical protein
MPVEVIIMTNNPKLLNYTTARGPSRIKLRYIEGTVLMVFTGARDLIHRGHRLLSHPLSSSLKPGAIPYKTIFLSAQQGGLDLPSLTYIENSIAVYHKTQVEIKSWPEDILEDYAVVDLALAKAALESLE